jgi:hypothetical protein
MQRAISVSERAQERSERARVEIEPGRDSRDEAVHFAVQPEEAPQEEIATLQAQKPPPPTVEPSVSTHSISGSAYAAQQAMLEASQIYNRGVSQSELQRLDKAPDEVVRRLVQAMDSISRALTWQPGFAAAWMLKGLR